MARCFLAHDCYEHLQAVEPSTRAAWYRLLLPFLENDKADNLNINPLSSGDCHCYSLKLDNQYQMLIRQLHPDGGADDSAWIFMGLSPESDFPHLSQSMRLGWDGETAGIVRVHPETHRLELEKPLFCFSGRELENLGVSKNLLNDVRAAQDEQSLKKFEGDLTPKTYYRLLDNLEKIQDLDDDLDILSDKTKVEDLKKLEAEISENLDDLFHSDRFLPLETSELLQSIFEKNLPAWMIFPNPDQKKWITRNLKGPMLIRGVAGSGKTAIAFCRAQYLASEILSGPEQKILLVTPIVNNAKLLNEHKEQWGGSFQNQIEIQNIYAFGNSLLQHFGSKAELNPTLALQTLQDAIDTCRPGMSNITQAHLDFKFVREEIALIIKGRSLHSQPEYLGLNRKGLGTPLNNEERRQIWRIYLKYQDLLAEKKIMDSEDLLTHAYRNLLQKGFKSPYAAIIIDDAHEMPPVSLKILHHLVKNRPNGLFMISDTSQKITRVGDYLSNLGINLTVRSPLLRTNMRNSKEIAEIGLKVLGDHIFDELDSMQVSNAVQPEVHHHGPPPTVLSHESEEDEILWILELIGELTGETYGYSYKDIGLIARSNRYLTLLEVNLTQGQIPCQVFKKSGHDVNLNAVQICSFTESRGLEFPVVILTEINEGILPKIPSGIDTDEMSAHLSREARLLFTGLSRAKDLLYMSGFEEPSQFLLPFLSEETVEMDDEGGTDAEAPVEAAAE